MPSDLSNSLPISKKEIIIDVPEKPSIHTDPGLRFSIFTFPVNKKDHIRKEYLQLESCQP